MKKAIDLKISKPLMLFVWDFHGVLEKGNEDAVIDISNTVLEHAGYKERFTEEDNERYYGLKWYQYFEQLLPKLSMQDCMDLQTSCFKYAESNLNVLSKHIKPNDYVVEVLTNISSSGNKQIVVSNTRQNDLYWFLNSIGIKEYFDEDSIFGVNAHQTHSTKTDALRDYIGDVKFDKIIIIGDSEDDLKMGRAVGAINYFYKHPHRTHEDTVNADHTIKDLRAILDALD
jgi:phosphoglycolate phosphatase-like HAD superfamily hydrolase